MATVVHSRFHGLKIEDDDSLLPSQNDQKSKKTKANAVKKAEPVKKNKSATKPAQNGGDALGMMSSQLHEGCEIEESPKMPPALKPSNPPSQGKKKNKKPVVGAEQWEQWKQKDEQLVDGNYENELEQAILLSKLDFEEKKDVYKQLKKDADLEKKVAEQNAKAGSKKQKKKNVMSLDQFKDMVSGNDELKRVDLPEDMNELQEEPKAVADTEYFERVQDEAKMELQKDKINERVKQRKPVSDSVISRVQFSLALESKNKQISELRTQVDTLKEELLMVKSRNKKLCNILGQGEMRDKAQVLVEVERLRQVQTELTQEVESLHTQLEQERSRNADPRTKDKRYPCKKKQIRFDVSTEVISSK